MPSQSLAAIDLGSNSFHLIVSRLVDGNLVVVDRLKEMVQLAAGLDDDHRLSPEVEARAMECLARFGERLREIPGSRVRVVGTNTLRQLRDGGAFLARARTLLGRPVEIISGIEEARLIYLGVANTMGSGEGRKLVVDIGGGSTELIIGEGFEPLHLDSLYMGCVSMTRAWFASGRIRESALRQAELEVQLELEPLVLEYRTMGWQRSIGASGTVKAIRDAILVEGCGHGTITREGLDKMRERLLSAGSANALARRWGLSRPRARVLAGGFVVLYTVCETLGIDEMEVSEGALREGVIFDLVGRIRDEDVRDRTVATLIRRYGVDPEQAARVEATALALLEQVRGAWGLDDEAQEQDLAWAARLHELGLAIAHNHYHRHGAYVIEHSDMPGFGRGEQALLAALVRGHRRKFPVEAFQELPESGREGSQRLCVLLRLAVLRHRGRSPQPLPPVSLRCTDPRTLQLRFPAGWLADHPLTHADLKQEARLLAAAGYRLRVG